jgi:hypothetical protein
MPTNTTIESEGSKPVLVKTTGHNKLKITVMLAVLADRMKLTPFILKKKNLAKKKLPCGIIFKYNEKGWMAEDFRGEWPREVWDT